MISRRDVLRLATIASTVALAGPRLLRAGAAERGSARPQADQRRFTSPALEATIRSVKRGISDTKLAWMFENCLPNTLDTTVQPSLVDGKPDTFVVTGDIDAMWLRDSCCQLWPYLSLARADPALAQLIQGAIRRQTRCVLLDPYANAFLRDTSSPPLPWSVNDRPALQVGVGERKWELDSLCYVIRLGYGYWQATGDTSPFDSQWLAAMHSVLRTLREQQRQHGPGPYHFQRRSEVPSETLALAGYGNPARSVGMIYSMFRPSDDACIYPLSVPSNLFAATSLRQLARMVGDISHDATLANQCQTLASEVAQATHQYGQLTTPAGLVWAYEVDGYGNQLFMDDANAPGLLSLAYLGCCELNDPIYQRSRARVNSQANPYFFTGRAAQGIGGPHEGLRMIWPMSIIMRALTSTRDAEIRQCLLWLRDTDAGTGFMHESFDQDDPSHYTRPWFAWANSLFGELILKLARERPRLLASL